MTENAQETSPHNLLACIKWARQFPGLTETEGHTLLLLATYGSLKSGWLFLNSHTIMSELRITSRTTHYKRIRSLERKGAMLLRKVRGKNGGWRYEYDLPIRRDMELQAKYGEVERRKPEAVQDAHQTSEANPEPESQPVEPAPFDPNDMVFTAEHRAFAKKHGFNLGFYWTKYVNYNQSGKGKLPWDKIKNHDVWFLNYMAKAKKLKDKSLKVANAKVVRLKSFNQDKLDDYNREIAEQVEIQGMDPDDLAPSDGADDWQTPPDTIHETMGAFASGH